MKRRDFDLKSLLDIPLWENVQDSLSELTGTAIITIDFKGNPITKHSGRTEFCSVIRENAVLHKRCCRCDALAGLEAVRLGRPYIYLCHCGIVDAAVPISVGERYLGAVMFGEVRIPSEDTVKVKRLVNEISSFQSENNNLLEKYNRLPEMDYGQILQVAETINKIVKYIIERAVRNENQLLMYEYLMNTYQKQGDVVPQIQELGSSYESEVKLAKSNPVYLAVSYIETHPHEMITMNEMARLCHFSSSYFSRVFSREMGENFVNYVNRQKVKQARERLRNTADSVTQIALDLGYVDSSYFINVFKKFEGVTPLVYRQCIEK